MATRTRSTKTASAKGGTTKTAAKAAAKTKTTAKTDDGPSKSELRKARDKELMERVVEMRNEGESWSNIASELGITPGKAQFLGLMIHAVETGEVKRLRWSNDEELYEQIEEARTAADDLSSWGWIAARTGVSEAKIKRLAEFGPDGEGGFWEPKSENISVVRALSKKAEEDEDAPKASRKSRSNGGSKKADAKPASKAARAKARARATRQTEADPS